MKKRQKVGNAAATREALEMARDALKSAEKYVYGDPPNGGAIGWDDVWPSEWHNALEAVERALSAPPRNCDVGTAEDQAVRFRDMCNKYYDDENPCNKKCPLASHSIIHGFPRCQAYWAQMPYEAEEGAGE